MLRMHFLLALTAAAFLLPATTMTQAIAQPIYRCGNSYSQEACKGSKVVEDKTTTLHSGHSGGTVYLCKGHGGGLFWSSSQCGQHNAFLERTETVPSGLPWDQKVAQAEAQWRKTQRNTEAPAVVYQNRPTQPAEPGKKQACDALEERVKALDSMGRAGSQYYDLDWVRRERKVARDEQYRLKC